MIAMFHKYHSMAGSFRSLHITRAAQIGIASCLAARLPSTLPGRE
jgi:hypothetical protein